MNVLQKEKWQTITRSRAMGIQELVLENGIRILKKPVYITFEQIQECLDKAHEVNAVKGLVYATQGQTVEKLIEKLKYAVTYVALMPDVPDYAITVGVPARGIRIQTH